MLPQNDLEQKIDLALENIELKKREQEYTAEATKLREEKKQLENKIESLSPSPKKRKQFPIKYALLLLMGLTAIPSAYYGCRKINQSRAGEHYAQALRIIKDDPIDEEDAIQHLTRAIELHPGNPEYYAKRGSLYVNTNPAKALEDLNKALELGLKSYSINCDLSIAKFRNNHQKIIMAFRNNTEICKKEAEDALAHITVAAGCGGDPELYYMKGEILFSLAHLYIEEAPCEGRGADCPSHEFLRTQYYFPAIQAFSNAIHLDKDYYNAYVERGKLLTLVDFLDKAVEDFTAAIDICPRGDCSDAYIGRAQVLDTLGRVDEALGDCNEVIKYHPNTVEAYKLRAHLRNKKREYAKAEQDEATARDIGLGLERR